MEKGSSKLLVKCVLPALLWLPELEKSEASKNVAELVAYPYVGVDCTPFLIGEHLAIFKHKGTLGVCGIRPINHS